MATDADQVANATKANVTRLTSELQTTEKNLKLVAQFPDGKAKRTRTAELSRKMEDLREALAWEQRVVTAKTAIAKNCRKIMKSLPIEAAVEFLKVEAQLEGRQFHDILQRSSKLAEDDSPTSKRLRF